MNASDLLNNLVSYNMTTDYTAEESKVAQEYMAIIMKRAEEEYKQAFQWLRDLDG